MLELEWTRLNTTRPKRSRRRKGTNDDLRRRRHDVDNGNGDESTPTNMIGIRKVKLERHMDEERFLFERTRMTNVYVLSMKRTSYLVGFLITICHLSMVDTMNFLPAGIILYTFGVTMALELMSDTAANHIDLPWMDAHDEWKEARRREREADLEHHIRAAMFEYHVLKGRPNTKIIPREDKSGKVTLFAIG